jgi:hypothetical protein
MFQNHLFLYMTVLFVLNLAFFVHSADFEQRTNKIDME